MNDLVLLVSRVDSEVTWSTFKSDQCSGAIQQTSLDAVDWNFQPGAQLSVILPTEQIQLIKVNLPPLPFPKKILAASSVLEPKLAEPIENLHFALKEEQGDKSITPIAIISKGLMQQWQKRLRPFLRKDNVQLHLVTSEIYLLPVTQDGWTVFCDRDAIWVRTDDTGGVFTPACFLEWVKTSFLECSPTKICAFIKESSEIDLKKICQDRHIPYEQVDVLTPRSSFLLNQWPTRSIPINLLQGQFSEYVRNQRSKKISRVLIFSMMILLSLGITLTMGDFFSLLNKKYVVENIFKKQLSPWVGAKTIDDSYKKLMQERRKINERNDFLVLLKEVSHLIGDAHRMIVKHIEYKNRTLTLHVQAENFIAIEEIVKKRSPKISIKQKNLSQIDDNVIATLLIKRVGL